MLMAGFTCSLPAERGRERRLSLFPGGKTFCSPASAPLVPDSGCLWQTKGSAPRGQQESLEAKSSGGLVPPGQGMSFFQSLPIAAAHAPLDPSGGDVVPLQCFQAQQ